MQSKLIQQVRSLRLRHASDPSRRTDSERYVRLYLEELNRRRVFGATSRPRHS